MAVRTAKQLSRIMCRTLFNVIQSTDKLGKLCSGGALMALRSRSLEGFLPVAEFGGARVYSNHYPTISSITNTQ